jgi:hypothetical protein
MLLSQCQDADPSQRQAVTRLIAHRIAQKQPACSSNTGAYSNARQRLPEKILVDLTRHTGKQLMTQAPAGWSWHGRHVKVVDGSTASMPDTDANQKAYPQMACQKPGVGFPILRFLTVFSLSVGTVLDAAIGPYQGKQTSELALFRRLHDNIDAGDVVLADRFFCSFFEIAELQRRGVDVVVRQHQKRKTDFRRGVQLGRYDHLVKWPKPERPDWMDQATYEQYPDELLRYLVKNKIRMPIRPLGGPNRGHLEWHRPNRPTLQNLLKHPIYAGYYRWGHRAIDPRRKVAGRPRTGRTVRSPKECLVLLEAHCPAYITAAQFWANQARLEANRARTQSQGAERHGPSLLGGLLVCGRCGRRLLVQYTNAGSSLRYSCSQGLASYAEPLCQSLSGQRLDAFIVSQVLAALQPAALELHLAAAANVAQERQRLHQHWQQQLERARYETDRSARQYQAVEPENRLVAREL